MGLITSTGLSLFSGPVRPAFTAAPVLVLAPAPDRVLVPALVPAAVRALVDLEGLDPAALAVVGPSVAVADPSVAVADRGGALLAAAGLLAAAVVLVVAAVAAAADKIPVSACDDHCSGKYDSFHMHKRSTSKRRQGLRFVKLPLTTDNLIKAGRD